MRILVGLAAASLVLGGSLAVAGPFGPEGEFNAFLGSLEWKPKCRKPMRPFGNSKYEWEAYKLDVDSFIRCTNKQAQEDAEYAIEQIKEGRDKALDELRREIERGF